MPFYGPVLVPFVTDSGDPFLADADGNLFASQTYDLSDDSTFAGDFGLEQLLPLDLREFVIHGAFVDAGVGAGTPGEVDGSGGYIPILPVGANELAFAGSADFPSDEPDGTVIPTPSAALGGLALLGLAGLRRNRG